MASPRVRKAAGTNRPSPRFEGLVRELSGIAEANWGERKAGVAEVKAGLAEIMRRDYRQALHQCLSRWEVRQIAEEGKTHVWPGLNKEPVTLVSTNEFARRWSSFGVDFKFASLPRQEGLSLLGFYVNKIDRVIKRPLIFVNTAHHPAVVGLALDHEMGHHLTSQIFAAGEQPHLLSPVGFEEHLVEPAELAADVLVSLGMLPAPVARKLFGTEPGRSADSQSEELSASALAKLLEYIDSRYGFRPDRISGGKKRFQTLAGLVHYAKLRRALLDEYNT